MAGAMIQFEIKATTPSGETIEAGANPSVERVGFAALVDAIFLIYNGLMAIVAYRPIAVPPDGTSLLCSPSVPIPLLMKPNMGVSLDIERKGDEYIAYNGSDDANK
ncbi:hypothetical protein HG530_005897 [Fusarium avenaceum]|nr:hypothetical protein HG530_005897 [Fusarium avenaceum]